MDLEDTISDVAQAPAEITVDGLVTKEHPLPDLIAADKHLAGKTAAGKGHFGLRFSQIIPPGGQ